jgi:serine protease inhibitor
MKTLSTFLLVFLASGCQEPRRASEPVSTPEKTSAPLKAGTAALSKKAPLSADTKRLIRSTNRFAYALFRQLMARHGTKENLIVSPASLAITLAMAYSGAANQNAQHLRHAMRLRLPKRRLHLAYARLFAALKASPNKATTLALANAIWIHQTWPVRAAYRNVMRRYYGAHLRRLDFSKKQAASTINHWVKGATGGEIPQLIVAQLPADTRLLLMNVAYFKAAWASPFEPSKTKQKPFLLQSGKTITTPMMAQSHVFRFAEARQFKLLQLPYHGGQFSMLVLLPRQPGRRGLLATSRSLSRRTLRRTLARASHQEVNVELPRFKADNVLKLKKVLSKMGVARAFDPSARGFSGISKRGGLAISRVLQQARVAVDERGTIAVAATRTGIKSEAKPSTFIANRPFIYILRHERTGAVLFIGLLTDPRPSA